MNRRSVRIARTAQGWLLGRASAPVGSLAALLGATLRPLTTAERALPIAVAAIVAIASMLALLPGSTGAAVGSTNGMGADVRIAINGGLDRPQDGLLEYVATGDASPNAISSFEPLVLPQDVAAQAGFAVADAEAGTGALLDDGTLLTGYAPQTDVADGSDLIQRYKVKSGDTLVTIARHFGVSMMTLWWANNLKAKDDLHIGQMLRIPSVSGLVVTVKETDTLASLASANGVKPARILELNGLDDPTLVVGQVLVLPGAKGAPIPTPKPTPKPVARPRIASSAGGRTTGHIAHGGPATYTGGQFRWPVVGGGNYISQYFHAGHGAIDIAGDYGSPIVAAASGRVAFAGWKSNGGGWQVWISHGGGMYTTYNHMSGVSVGTGQSVGRGQRVGHLGASGNATGPHLHFEVWRGGLPWGDGHQVNPMGYF